MKRFAIVGALLCCTLSTAFAHEIEVGHGERLLVIAPHPDDETLAAGGLMQRVLAQGGRVQVLLMTAGDGYREAVAADAHGAQVGESAFVAYGERRLGEARAALNLLGSGHIRTDVIGFPDGAMASLLGDHWWRIAPAHSPFTHADRPPYPQAIDPHLPYAGVALRDALARILKATQPTIIALPDWIDAHPDHSASAIFVMLAIDDWLRAQGRQLESSPRLLAYIIHWDNWPPRPFGWKGKDFPTLKQTTALQLPLDLPPRHLSQQTLSLSDAEITTKSKALALHVSQRAVDPYLLGVFVRRTEPFTVITASELPRVRQAIEQIKQRHTPRG
jgi:LmbE family N-acetylglucosaminyl deacetylase